MSVYSDRIIADGAVAYWRLNEPSGTTAVDAVGGVNGTISGGVTLGVPGPMPGSLAMRFDGSTGKVAIPTGAYQSFGSGPAALECWIRYTGPTGAYTYVDCGAAVAATPGLILQCNTSNIVWAWSDGTLRPNTTGGTGSAAAAATDQLWRHLVVVYDHPANAFRLANNGVFNTGSYSMGAINVTVGVCLGQLVAGGGAFPGEIAEVAIYKTALTPAQMAAHYITGTAAATPSPWVPLAVAGVL